jgi:hypothetical protein
MSFKPFKEAVKKYCKDKNVNSSELVVQNAVIESVNVAWQGHYNITTLELMLKLSDNGYICALGTYNLREILGVVADDFIRQFVGETDDTVTLDRLNGKPVRAILASYSGPVVGLGHFLDDKFIMFEDYLKEKIVQVTDTLCGSTEHVEVRKGEGQ